ncbi:probable E3 ubiquitin-protein ligase RHY1A [Brachypodium distachyon]|uniref:RING-type domain-containing protein n=1 Tax=Brachypodium distachyon TaxID=15368 RepID=I1IKU3_BRADI|nr:probable E3 ubiquitin-protein ligase RHY1A [Brachypodium distachyon]KQJ88078.1 hypothetical protein BRADI_4g15190v3 [Brachypodium distachyon]|eukprot:XP_003577423.1 probable E3 ubiquitin-protein ligase RHY1A [Brachypodium distachyon]
MLPGVELARRRRVHYRGDGVGGAAGGDHHQQLGATAQAVSGVVGPALAARIRLEEKLRGAAAPSSSSRWGRLTRDKGASSRQQNIQQEQQQVLTASTEFRSPSTAPALPITTGCSSEMNRTLSKADVCAVCLDEVWERRQRVTRLPCSHRYHSDCVLPWLAIQPDCPCCRTVVPSVDTLS